MKSGHAANGRNGRKRTLAKSGVCSPLCGKAPQSGRFSTVSMPPGRETSKLPLAVQGAQLWNNTCPIPRETCLARQCEITGGASKTRAGKSNGRRSGTSMRNVWAIPPRPSSSGRIGPQMTFFAVNAIGRHSPSFGLCLVWVESRRFGAER